MNELLDRTTTPEALLGQGAITVAQARACFAFREDWRASVGACRRRSAGGAPKVKGPSPGLSLNAAARERYLRASEAVGAWRGCVMWMCCGMEPHGGRDGYEPASVLNAAERLRRFYGM